MLWRKLAGWKNDVPEIQIDPEYHRVNGLPRRAWTPEQEQAAVAHYTGLLRSPTGQQILRPIQAVALAEAQARAGLLGAIYVGEGKTLLSALLAVVMQLSRPVLLLPSALVEKTREEFNEYSKHWKLPRNLEIVSFELLSKAGRVNMLTNLRPDGIIVDEVHRLKNPKAAVTRRVARLFEEFPQTMFFGFSGTLITDALKDMWHLAKWAFKDASPLPTNKGVVDAWDLALSETQFSMQPGALLNWPIAEEHRQYAQTQRSYARFAVQKRMVDTLGFVKSKEGDGPQCSLLITAKMHDAAQITRQHFKRLREQWETPDGWAFTEGIELWRHARELALGFHYMWSPRPPDGWLQARRIWARVVRKVIEASDRSDGQKLDSEKMVRDAVRAGGWAKFSVKIVPTVEEEERAGMPLEPYYVTPPEAWDHWSRWEPHYTIQQVAQWHDDSVLKACADWMHRTRGIVWTEHQVFGLELSRLTGVPFYAEKGLDQKGNFIMTHAKAGDPLIVSRPPNATGRNLQGWADNLITSLSSNPTINEQLLGRTHRKGQLKDTVSVEVLLSCREHFDAMIKARSRAQYVQQTMGQTQRLIMADIPWPSQDVISREAIHNPCMQTTADIDTDIDIVF